MKQTIFLSFFVNCYGTHHTKLAHFKCEDVCVSNRRALMFVVNTALVNVSLQESEHLGPHGTITHVFPASARSPLRRGHDHQQLAWDQTQERKRLVFDAQASAEIISG